MQQVPIGKQLLAMKFHPGFYKPLLTLRQSSADHFERFDAVDRHLVLVVGMEMRQVVGRLRFGEHADDDPKKPAQFRHDAILPQFR